jgi:transcriptional regulator with XRE-family HTH domain
MGMTPDDAEEYTQALGQVMAGGWRQIALAGRLGVPETLGFDSTRDWVEERLGGYVRMSIPERREAARELEAEGLQGQEIADVLGVDPATVSRDLHADDEPEIADAIDESEPEPEPQVSDADDEPEIADAIDESEPEPEAVDKWAEAITAYPFLDGLPAAGRSDFLAAVAQLDSFDAREREHRIEMMRRHAEAAKRPPATADETAELQAKANEAAQRLWDLAATTAKAASDLLMRWDDWHPEHGQLDLIPEAVGAASSGLAEIERRLSAPQVRRVK